MRGRVYKGSCTNLNVNDLFLIDFNPKLVRFLNLQMEEFRSWMKRRDIWNILYMSNNKAEMKRIILELQDQPVGVSCDGVFKCTYSFIAQVS